MSAKIIIRKETLSDYRKTEYMVRRAFWNIHGPGCNEHLLVRILRESPDYLPEFSRIAELDGEVVGAVFYSKAKVIDGNTTHEVVTFGPLAAEPTLQNSGVGKMLLEETFRLVKEAGYPAILIFGEPEYYPKIGFRRCREYGIKDVNGNCWDAMMAYPLDSDAFSKVHGVFIESSAFDKCDDETALAQMEKEFPAYPKIKIQDGFLQIFGGRFGTVKSVNNDEYIVKFWELDIPARLCEDSFPEGSVRPAEGDIVIFDWKRNGISVITKLCHNML